VKQFGIENSVLQKCIIPFQQPIAVTHIEDQKINNFSAK
jgi:hypothetical protein